MRSGQVACAAMVIVLGSVGMIQAAETIAAVATLKTAGGTTATTPVSVTVDRITPAKEAETLVAAFKASGAAGLRTALKGIPPTGSIRIGGGAPTPTRLTIERRTDKGRLLTIVTDKPLFFVGAGQPAAKPKAGHDFAVVDVEIAADGSGAGTIAPAATIKMKDGAFVVDDYGADVVQLVVKSAR